MTDAELVKSFARNIHNTVRGCVYVLPDHAQRLLHLQHRLTRKDDV